MLKYQFNIILIVNHPIPIEGITLFASIGTSQLQAAPIQIMKVRDAKPGDIVEPLYNGAGYNNLYRVTGFCSANERVTALTRFTKNKVMLYPDNDCRLIDPKTVDF